MLWLAENDLLIDYYHIEVNHLNLNKVNNFKII